MSSVVLLLSIWTLNPPAFAAGASESPVKLVETSAAGVRCRLIRVNLSDARVRVSVEVPDGFPGPAESFDSMVRRLRPVAAINGAYFSVDTGRPIGDIVIGGRLRYQGLMGTALALTPDRQGIIRRVRPNRAEDWRAYDTVLCCGPALLLDGQVDVQPDLEGFHDSHVTGRTQRMAAGFTRDRKLLLVHILDSVDFRREAEVMRSLGCESAVNLDAGASLAMHYEGRTLRAAGRPLTNLLCVYLDGGQARVERSARGAAAGYSPPPKGSPQVTVRVCAETGLRANEYCEVSVPRAYARGRQPRRVCGRHHELR